MSYHGMTIMPQRILRHAIAASLAIHVVVAHFVRPPSVSAASEPPPERSVIIHIRPPVKKVVPTPTPRPQPQHHTAISARSHPPKLTYHTNVKGASTQRHVAIATAAPGGISPIGPDNPLPPEPSATPGTPVPVTPPTPSCTEPDVAAHVLNAITPETPELARQEGLSGVTEVRVDLGADGTVESVSVYRSSGSTLLDAAALGAAKASRYAAMQHDCKSFSGSYIFKAEFDN